MTKTASLLAALALGLAPLYASSLVGGRIYDVDKYESNRDDFRVQEDWQRDADLCWAAAGACIIQHWQDFYLSAKDEGQEVPSGVEKPVSTAIPSTGCLKPYNYLLKHWSHGPGFNMNVLTWWLRGELANPPAQERAERLKLAAPQSGGGFFKSLFPEATRWKEGQNGPCGCVVDHGSTDYAMTDASPRTRKELKKILDAAFSKGGQAVLMGLQMFRYGQDGKGEPQEGHCLCCWGYEKGGDGLPDALYFTDSDDAASTVFRVDVEDHRDGVTCRTSDPASSFHTGPDMHVFLVSLTYINTPEGTARKKGPAAKLPDKGAVERNTLLTAKAAYKGDLRVAASPRKGFTVLRVEDKLNLRGYLDVEPGAQFSLRGSKAELAVGGIRNSGRCYLRGRLVFLTEEPVVENRGYLELCDCGELRLPELPSPGRTAFSGDTKLRIGDAMALSAARGRIAVLGCCRITENGISGSQSTLAQISDLGVDAGTNIITIENARIMGKCRFKARGIKLQRVSITLPDDGSVTLHDTSKVVEVDATGMLLGKVDGTFNAGLSKSAAEKYRRQGYRKLRVVFDPNEPNMTQEFPL